jgi:hypothetical protein
VAGLRVDCCLVFADQHRQFVNLRFERGLGAFAILEARVELSFAQGEHVRADFEVVFGVSSAAGVAAELLGGAPAAFVRLVSRGPRRRGRRIREGGGGRRGRRPSVRGGATTTACNDRGRRRQDTRQGASFRCELQSRPNAPIPGECVWWLSNLSQDVTTDLQAERLQIRKVTRARAPETPVPDEGRESSNDPARRTTSTPPKAPNRFALLHF